MKLMLAFIVIPVALTCFSGNSSADDKKQIKVAILYDNTIHAEGCQSDWGFSCLIEGLEQTILFDTGTQSEILFHNIEQLGVNPKSVDLVVLSHDHGDHTGGLARFLEANSDVTVYYPVSFSQTIKQTVQDAGAKGVDVTNPVTICKDVHLTGELGDAIKEQAIVLETSRGLVVITGCAHPGIVKILEHVKNTHNKNIELVFGGFHLMTHSEAQVHAIVDEFQKLGVKQAGATHCTGEGSIAIFRERYGEDFVPMGVGRVLTIER